MPFIQTPDPGLLFQAGAAAFAAARLLRFGLRGRFPLLCLYLLFSGVLSTILSVLAIDSKAYFAAYMVGQPLSWCTSVLAVHEMFALIFKDYPGIESAGKWALYTGLALALCASVAIARLFWPEVPPSTPSLFYELILERSILFGLAVIIAIQMWFLSRYPLHLERNTYVSSGCFSAMFIVQAVARLVDSRASLLFVDAADWAEVGFTALCFIVWGIMLQPANAPIRVRPPANKPREAELLQQLAAMNAILSRSVFR